MGVLLMLLAILPLSILVALFRRARQRPDQDQES